MLYIIATPIGNLKDITQRALETLGMVDTIVCEDSRHSSLLLNHYQIKKPLIILNDYNEAKEIDRIITRLSHGDNMALISDAGTPLISDPGYKLVRRCLSEGVEVDSLPGPSSPIVALTLSGLPPDKFFFLGYPPDKPGHRVEFYKKIKEVSQIMPATFILFIAPFKLIKTLDEVKESLGDIPLVLAKELTKLHQKVESKLTSEWLAQFKTQAPVGEYICLLRA